MTLPAACIAHIQPLLPAPRHTQVQKRCFEADLKNHTLVHEQLIQFYKGFKHDAHPMAIMVSGAWCLACAVACVPFGKQLACGFL